jgi:hypothetical protein
VRMSGVAGGSASCSSRRRRSRSSNQFTDSVAGDRVISCAGLASGQLRQPA